MAEDIIKEIAEEETLDIEELPIHELRRRVGEAKIKMKSGSNKADYVEALRSGESNVEARKVKRQSHLEESKPTKSIALLPPTFDEVISTRYPNIRYELDEVSNCINFFPRMAGDRSVIPGCVNIDVPVRLIFEAAASASRGRLGGKPIIDDRNDAQAARIDQEVRDRKALRAEIEAELRMKEVN